MKSNENANSLTALQRLAIQLEIQNERALRELEQQRRKLEEVNSLLEEIQKQTTGDEPK